MEEEDHISEDAALPEVNDPMEVDDGELEPEASVSDKEEQQALGEDEIDNSQKAMADKVKSVRKEHKEALQRLREEQQKTYESEQEKSAATRLKYLIQQTEIFSHFISGRKQKSQSSQTPTKRGRMTEKEEDEETMKEAIEDMQGTVPTRLTVQPPFIQGKLREYQLDGLNWLIKLYENGINGILADEMGLGKTLQTISFLTYLKEVREVKGPHLVIAPKSTLQNWVNEFHRFCPIMKVIKFHGSKEERARIRDEELSEPFDVLITSYEIVIIEKAALKKFNWRYLVIDEAHRIKNENSVLSQVVRLYKSQYRLLITGTPLQNNLHELWALLNFLLPDVFSSSVDFDNWFNLKQTQEHQEIIQKLHRVLRPFLLRRLKSDVEKNLPPKKEIKLYVGISSMQREWYTKILMKDITAINEISNKTESRFRLLNIVMQLRKACNHPYLFDGAEPQPYTNDVHLIQNSGKLTVLDKLLPKLKSNDSRVLIFSQMTRMLDILEDYLVFKGYEYCRIDGSTSGEDRDSQIEEYNRPGSSKFVFLLSTRAGGLGINLASADIVILYDSDWNPQVDLQAQDRAHRIGQTKQVTVFRFVSAGTLEEKIIERAEAKLHLDALVIQQGRLVEQNKALTSDEMRNMIKFGADEIFQSKDSTITDEDIDLILSKGEERTQQLNEKLQKNLTNMQTLSLDGSSNLYEFQGVDYSGGITGRSHLKWIEPPKRERKQNFNVDAYYRNVLRVGEPKKQGPPRPPKQPVIHDFQFFPPRLHELFEKETELYLRKLEAQNKKEGETPAQEEPGELTPEEQEEKETLLQRGFLNWSRREFHGFIRGCEKFGRESYDNIAKEITTKDVKEVKAYAQVFWKKYKDIHDSDRIIRNIEKGEQRIQRFMDMTVALDKKMKQYKNPWNELRIQYHAQAKGKTYTEEEDQFLVCMTYKVGYGNWEELKTEIRKAWQFRFDWFIKSRTSQELNRRVEILVRLIEKENQEMQEKKEKEEEKRKEKEKERMQKEKEKEKLKKEKHKEKDKEKPKEKDTKKKKVDKESDDEREKKAPKSPSKEQKGTKRSAPAPSTTYVSSTRGVVTSSNGSSSSSSSGRVSITKRRKTQ